MITHAYIRDTLVKLDKLYNNPRSQKETNLYTKLALLELCGWVEESMDNIVKIYGKRKLKTEPFKKLHLNIIDKNYGFKYEYNFRPMLIQTIGIIQVEKLETDLNKLAKIDILSSELTRLNKLRNKAAHTYTKGTTASFAAPSVTLGIFHIIYPILLEIDQKLKTL